MAEIATLLLATTVDLCSDGCLPSFRGDGVCDSVCNVQACGFDNDDCPKPVVQECSPECRLDMVGDGTCQSQCQVEECSFDASDCLCAQGCFNSSLGDGILGLCQRSLWREDVYFFCPPFVLDF